MKDLKHFIVMIINHHHLKQRVYCTNTWIQEYQKTAGLKEILKLHHIDIKDIVTFGDADNDYDMTLNAGVGVVMANGSEKTKSVADYITDDNDHDGIGNYIEKYIL